MCRIFDGMAAQLAREKEKVLAHARSLEVQVEERTRHLDKALNEVRHLARAADAAGDAIIITDVEGKIVWVNHGFTEVTGYPLAEVLGLKPSLLKSDQQPPEFYRALWTEILAGRVWSGRLVNKRRDGVLYHAEQTIAPVLDSQGRIEGFVAVHRDITAEARREQERLALEEELRQKAALLEKQNQELSAAREQAEAATRAKSVFLANMSHEIRTPLNAIVGMTGLLLDGELPPEQQEYVETIRSGGDSLLNIINDILDFSKIEAGRLELEELPFDLRDCLEEALDLVAPRAAEKGLDLAYLIDHPAPGTLVGDVTRLRQILVNLLSNAVKFTSAGEVVVSVTGL